MRKLNSLFSHNKELNQLAQANNREFKKAFANYS